MRRLAERMLLAGLAIAIAAGAQAATLQLDRTRLDLSARERIAQLSIANTGETPALIQSEAYLWRQRGGADEMEPTTDLLVSPPIFEVAPGATQLLRVGLLAQADPTREASYRLVLQEVPRAVNNEGAAVAVLLRISFPVFVQPPIPAAPVFNWRAARTATGVRVTLSNSGNAHARLTGLAVSLPDGTRIGAKRSFLSYVLPGEAVSWDLPTTAPWSGGALRVEAATARGSVNAELQVGGGS